MCSAGSNPALDFIYKVAGQVPLLATSSVLMRVKLRGALAAPASRRAALLPASRWLTVQHIIIRIVNATDNLGHFNQRLDLRSTRIFLIRRSIGTELLVPTHPSLENSLWMYCHRQSRRHHLPSSTLPPSPPLASCVHPQMKHRPVFSLKLRRP